MIAVVVVVVVVPIYLLPHECKVRHEGKFNSSKRGTLEK